ncbi:uncharacterized protein LOC131846457 [Achroia grisella]|uniref:uncharacterized protein LOC131846457 n=1 Tax=Achroia grisella TaxID=688607 RepID=UPI0027D2C942|nr:uncharacterized protein LOC131846457 [Achroia grisella]
MWKYLLRRFRETVERSVNCFDKRSTTTGIVNSIGNIPEENNNQTGPPCRWFLSYKKCWKSFSDDNGANSKKWNFENLNHSYTWLGAITWSGVLVMGWYATQLTYLKHKYHSKQCKNKNTKPISNLLSILYPYVSCVNKNPGSLNSSSKIESVIRNFTPTVHLMSNDNLDSHEKSNSDTNEDDPTVKEFKNVLNVIENKLALSAIENGQAKDGLKLLRSAANRNYAPALYNLGLCYEKGIGVQVDEKMAMQLYQSAAVLEHPDALYNLGVYYGQGRGGLIKDTEMGTRLLRLAAVQGHETAVKALKSLDGDMPSIVQENKMDMWNFNYSPLVHAGNIAHTTLFVENVNYLNSQKYVQELVF